MLSAPTRCSPRGYGGLLAIDHSLCILSSKTELVVCFFRSIRSSEIRTGRGTQSAPTGCSPRDRGRLLAVDCGLSSSFLDGAIVLSLSFFTPCTRLRWAGRVGSEPVGARKVHPLGVVPETMVDCGQSTIVLVLIVFVDFHCKITSPL